LPTLPELRLRKFLTQSDLAVLIGVHPRQVSDWERGRFRPSMRHLRAICEVLEVEPNDITWPKRRAAAPITA
jgi:transcriptional regulator with XRE-family HTH domain